MRRLIETTIDRRIEELSPLTPDPSPPNKFGGEGRKSVGGFDERRVVFAPQNIDLLMTHLATRESRCQGNIVTMEDANWKSCPEMKSPTDYRPPHGLLWVQVVLAIVAVVVGTSEANPALSWAQWLIPIVYLIGPALVALPLVITAISTHRRVSSIRTTAALLASISLTVVGIRGMLPLVQ